MFPFHCDTAILFSDRSQADLWNCSLADVSGGTVITQRNFTAKLTVWADCIIIDCFGNCSFVSVIQSGEFNIFQFCPFGGTFLAAVNTIAVGAWNFVPYKIYDNIFFRLFNCRAFELCCTGQAFGVIFTVDFLTVLEGIGLYGIQVGFFNQSGVVCIGCTGRGNCCDCFP